MSASVLKHPASPLREIVVCQARNGQWVAWILHRRKGWQNTRTEYGARHLVVDAAKELSRRCGLPVRYQDRRPGPGDAA